MSEQSTGPVGGQIEQPREDKRTRRSRPEPPATPTQPSTQSEPGPSGSEAGDRLTPAQYEQDGREDLPAQYEF